MSKKTLTSFTSANQFPYKLLATNIISKGKIMPVHVQLCPTNKCNLNCHFCSCSDRDKSMELSLEQIYRLVMDMKFVGTKAVTITGGGEALCHPDIVDVIRMLNDVGISIGLVTNGLLLNRIATVLDLLTWVRISYSDYREFKDIDIIDGVTDWSFSYVVSDKPDTDNIQRVVDFANRHNFTHIRLVHDLCNLENAPDLNSLDLTNDRLVIRQSRVIYAAGAKHCYISLLKPVIAADGNIYPCCGVQYAIDDTPKDFISEMIMGTIGNFNTIYKKQLFFDGSICNKCYYGAYNEALAMILSLKHEDFV